MSAPMTAMVTLYTPNSTLMYGGLSPHDRVTAPASAAPVTPTHAPASRRRAVLA